MKEKRENYVKPLSYVIESEQPLMSGSAPGVNTTTPENRPGRMGVRRYEDYEDYEDYEEEDDWN